MKQREQWPLACLCGLCVPSSFDLSLLIFALDCAFICRRHRTEISKIPMYADSILRMLKDIRKTVRASSKLQPGPNAFAQFLEEVSEGHRRTYGSLFMPFQIVVRGAVRGILPWVSVRSLHFGTFAVVVRVLVAKLVFECTTRTQRLLKRIQLRPAQQTLLRVVLPPACFRRRLSFGHLVS